MVSGWERAVVVVGGDRLLLVLLAGLVTLTTRTTDMVDAAGSRAAAAAPVGVDAERVGLLLALASGRVPVVVSARRARSATPSAPAGCSASPRAFAVPLVVRSLRHADALGEALVARGVDD